ncbi:MAG TPA: CbtB domain-containing protein [Geminicoccus sp.]|uniref:CbtB domain-containing protein n=1 Tax=Geminicoccus sp. TaxID=2024832 RepID=UPI002E31881C|nr:CbtB domain-containing protein [Geminicoccus sp.]HEX2529093.1 CbtB domain-containing protein [Geminicoccus sp.]
MVQGARVARPVSMVERATAVVATLLLGTFLVWGAGFANSQVLHDAAHDGRHSFAFPCH